MNILDGTYIGKVIHASMASASFSDGLQGGAAMLLCRYCDFYRDLRSPIRICSCNRPAACKGGICGYTGVVFSDDPENLDIEYPCFAYGRHDEPRTAL